MKAFLRQLHHRKHLLFLDLEGTQFSHEMIAFGAVKARLKPDGSIARSYKGIKRYVKSKNSIGSFVKKLTGITREQLDKDGITYGEALKAIRNYCGKDFEKTAFVTFGSHDIRIFNQSLKYSPDADETIVKHISKYHVDMSALLAMFIRDDKSNPLSLANYLKTFELEFDGTAHDPLDDARNLVRLYKTSFTRKDIFFDEYLKLLSKMRHIPEPLLAVLKKLINDEDVSAAFFKDKVREFIG